MKKRYREKTQADEVTEGADMKDIGNQMHLFHQFLDSAPVEHSKPEGKIDKTSEFYHETPREKKKR